MISLLSLQPHGNLAPVILSFSVLVLIAQRPHTEYNDAIRVSNYSFEEVRHPMCDSSHSKRNPHHCKILSKCIAEVHNRAIILDNEHIA